MCVGLLWEPLQRQEQGLEIEMVGKGDEKRDNNYFPVPSLPHVRDPLAQVFGHRLRSWSRRQRSVCRVTDKSEAVLSMNMQVDREQLLKCLNTCPWRVTSVCPCLYCDFPPFQFNTC